jgi:hypothetical protein
MQDAMFLPCEIASAIKRRALLTTIQSASAMV